MGWKNIVKKIKIKIEETFFQLGIFFSLTGEKHFPNWRKKRACETCANLQTCKTCRASSPPHTYAYTRACEGGSGHSLKFVLSTAGVPQPAFVCHAFQHGVYRAGSHSAPFALQQGLSTGEAERKPVKEHLLRRFRLRHDICGRKERKYMARMKVQRFRK